MNESVSALKEAFPDFDIQLNEENSITMKPFEFNGELNFNIKGNNSPNGNIYEFQDVNESLNYVNTLLSISKKFKETFLPEAVKRFHTDCEISVTDIYTGLDGYRVDSIHYLIKYGTSTYDQRLELRHESILNQDQDMIQSDIEKSIKEFHSHYLKEVEGVVTMECNEVEIEFFIDGVPLYHMLKRSKRVKLIIQEETVE